LPLNHQVYRPKRPHDLAKEKDGTQWCESCKCGFAKFQTSTYCPSNSHAKSNWASQATGWRPDDWRYTYIHYPYWATYRCAYDPSGTLDFLIAKDASSASNRVIVSDNITIDVGADHANSISRNHLGTGFKPAGGNVLHNDNIAHWQPFEDVKLRVSVPLSAPHQRHFYF